MKSIMNATINQFSPTQIVRGTEALQDIIKVVMSPPLNIEITTKNKHTAYQFVSVTCLNGMTEWTNVVSRSTKQQ